MAFDAYYKWLGIPPEEQPADHYRLLAIARFESDPDVIDGAADRQMAHVRTFQTGQHSALSQKILNELAATRLCLLTPEKKAAYDATLRRRLDAAQPPQPAAPQPRPAAPQLRPLPTAAVLSLREAIPAAAAAPLIVTDDVVRPHLARRRPSGIGRSAPAWVALAAVAIPALAFVGYLIRTKPVPEPQRKTSSLPVPKKTPAKETGRPGPQTTTAPQSSGDGNPSPSPLAPTSGSRSAGRTKSFACEIHGPSRGRWSIDGDELVQSDPVRSVTTILFGDADWKDFDFSVEAKRTDGNEQCAVWCRYQDDGNADLFAVGVDGNAQHVVECSDNGRRTQPATRKGSLASGTWYRLEVHMRGKRGECCLDGHQILSFETSRERGRLGLRTWGSSFRFRNIVVKDSGGEVLLEGLPDLENSGERKNDNPGGVAGKPGPSAHGFVALFNGKNLTGWRPHPARQGLWRVDEDGVLVGSGPAASNLFTERGNFTNFHLRLEASINDGGNSGVFGRASFVPTLSVGGYEAQINSTGTDKNKTGSLYGAPGAVVQKLDSITPPNQWFTLELIAQDNHIVVKVNGQTTADWSDSSRKFPMGHIALQQHDPQTVVKFRKIEIREDSPSTGDAVVMATPAETEQAAAGPSPTIANEPTAHVKPAEPTPPRRSFADIPSESNTPRLTAKEAFSLPGHTGAVTRLAFHRSMPVLASAGKDGQVLLWDVGRRGLQLSVHKFREEVWAIKFSPDGTNLALANRHWWGSRLFFKTLTGQQLNEVKDFKHGGGAVASMAYSPDGRLFAAGQDDGTIRLWDIKQFREVAPVAFGLESNVWALAFGPVTESRKTRQTEYLLAAGGRDGELRTLAVTYAKSKGGEQCTFKPTTVAFGRGSEVLGVRFSPDGKLVACARRDGSAGLYNPRTGESVRDLQRGGGAVEWIAFHPQCPWCVTAHNNERLARIWNRETAELLCELRGHTGGVMCAEFSPDGRQVATASEDFSIKLWDLAGPGVPAAGPKGKKGKLAALVVGE